MRGGLGGPETANVIQPRAFLRGAGNIVPLHIIFSSRTIASERQEKQATTYGVGFLLSRGASTCLAEDGLKGIFKQASKEKA